MRACVLHGQALRLPRSGLNTRRSTTARSERQGDVAGCFSGVPFVATLTSIRGLKFFALAPDRLSYVSVRMFGTRWELSNLYEVQSLMDDIFVEPHIFNVRS